MPNWKTYDASVRLLSAIMAAHPNLKLNYDEVGLFYGGGAKYKTIWDGMNSFKRVAKDLAAAVERGEDPMNVNAQEIFLAAAKVKDISASFGGDCTKSAIDNRFRRLKSDAKLINDAVANGIDPITINVGDTNGQVARKELHRYYGNDTTPIGLQKAISRYYTPKVNLLRKTIEDGGDVTSLDLSEVEINQQKSDIQRNFGNDVTPKALQHAVSRYWKPKFDLIRETVAAGGDPQHINLLEVHSSRDDNMKDIARYLDDDTTASALEHRFRPIKKEAIAMRKSIAGQFQQGISGKAVSTRIERMRKEPAWDLSINTGVGDGSTPAKATPRKRGPNKTTPSKAKGMNGNGNGAGIGSGGDDDDDESDFGATPTKKKGVLNKTKGGRVTKAKGGKSASASATQSFEVDDDDESEGQGMNIIKNEERYETYGDYDDNPYTSFAKQEYYDKEDDDEA